MTINTPTHESSPTKQQSEAAENVDITNIVKEDVNKTAVTQLNPISNNESQVSLNTKVEYQHTGPYKNSNDHLWHELAEADAWLRAQTVRWQHTIANHKPVDYWGMVHISEAEVNAFLENTYTPPNECPKQIMDAIQPYWDTANTIAAAITHSVAQTDSKIPLRLKQLETLFKLSRYDAAVIKLCLLPQLDSRYRRLYGYLLDDASQTVPTVELILQILQPLQGDMVTARSRFSARAPLCANQIISLSDDQTTNGLLGARTLQLNDRIFDFVMGNDALDNQLTESKVCELIVPTQSIVTLNNLIAEETQLNYLHSLADWLIQQKTLVQPPPILYFHGVEDNGQLECASALCHALNKPLIQIDCQVALHSTLPWSKLVKLVMREALLQNGIVFWRNSHVLTENDQHITHWRCLDNAIEVHDGIVFLGSERIWLPPGQAQLKPNIRIEFTVPSYPLRQRLWQTYLPQPDELAGDANYRTQLANSLANSFQLNAAQIITAVRVAKDEARRRDPHNPLMTRDDFYAACRRQSSRGLMTFAKLIEPRVGLEMEALVLPEANMRQLNELRARIRYRSEVYSGMGFEKRLSLGKGLIVVFAGSSGTGKTMATELLAKEYGVQLYKVDLSAVVSKYVGETEKNLARVFNEAEDANAILLFDEGESLFGKRGEVKEARDRWANIEASFLLQRVEEYRGVVIVTTNRRQDIEPAFWRRIDTVVEFPRPDALARYHIWQGMFPNGVICPSDEHIKMLADKFNLAGGNIKNAAVDAAFRAMREAPENAQNPEITIRHLVLGIAREEQKLGKSLTKGDFGEQFYQWVKESIL